jgi:hypothetical protein
MVELDIKELLQVLKVIADVNDKGRILRVLVFKGEGSVEYSVDEYRSRVYFLLNISYKLSPYI